MISVMGWHGAVIPKDGHTLLSKVSTGHNCTYQYMSAASFNSILNESHISGTQNNSSFLICHVTPSILTLIHSPILPQTGHQISADQNAKNRDLPMRTLCWSLANLAASILAVNKRYKLD